MRGASSSAASATASRRPAEAVCPGLLMLNSDHEPRAAWKVDLAAEPPAAEDAAMEAMPLAALEALAAARREDQGKSRG